MPFPAVQGGFRLARFDEKSCRINRLNVPPFCPWQKTVKTVENGRGR